MTVTLRLALTLLLTCFTIVSCSKDEIKNAVEPDAPRGRTLPPWVKTTPKNPMNVPMIPPPVTTPDNKDTVTRTLIRHLVIEDAFYARQDKTGNGSLHPTSTCMDIVKITKDGQSQEVIELINSLNCYTDTDQVKPEGEVFKRINFFKASNGFYRLYQDDKTRFLGDMHEQRSSDGKTILSMVVADLCTGTYYWEEPNGTCILTANEQGQFEELYVW